MSSNVQDSRVITGDCLEVLSGIPNGSVDLCFIDPPFNIDLEYPDYKDSRARVEYLDWLEGVLLRVCHTLTDTASLWVQCGQSIQADVYSILRGKGQGLHWRNSVVWHYTFGQHQKKKFVPSWQMLHWFTIHPKNFTFNDDSIRVPSARQIKYRDIRANPQGRIPDDVWTVSRVCGTFKERINHSCQTPLELLYRIINACSNPGDTILDPTCGTGSSCVAALKLDRKFIGIELSEETSQAARRRLERAAELIEDNKRKRKEKQERHLRHKRN